METWRTELTKNAFGGTELMMMALHEHLGEDYLKDFQIVPSRLVPLQNDKWRILWCHDLAHDSANEHLKNGGWRKFHYLVFVSHFQKEQYLRAYDIPPSRTVVLQNAIKPLRADQPRPERDGVRLVYHTTPHRGLEILVPVFEKLFETYGGKIHLDVFSSFGIYGWPERDQKYQSLFDRIKKHEGMTYHGWGENATIREHLIKRADIFAYPSIWPETSCIALMEAMSAGLVCVHPNYAALPETAANWTYMYNWHEDVNSHASIFARSLSALIEVLLLPEESELLKLRLANQKGYADLYYSWDTRQHQWRAFLEMVKQQPKELPRGPEFVYRTS